MRDGSTLKRHEHCENATKVIDLNLAPGEELCADLHTDRGAKSRKYKKGSSGLLEQFEDS